jgi:hypothetical protein
MDETFIDMNLGWNSLAADLLFACMEERAPAEELAFHERRIRASGGLALDQACGTGRHVLPLPRRGLQVDGADISADAIRHARTADDGSGLATSFHVQSVEDCDLPRAERHATTPGTRSSGSRLPAETAKGRSEQRSGMSRWTRSNRRLWRDGAMNHGWEPDDVIAVVDHLERRFGSAALESLDEALAGSAAAWGREIAASEQGPTSPLAFTSHFTSGPHASCRLIDSGDDHATMETAACRIFDIFKELGRPEVGYRFKCAQDYSIIKGYDETIGLEIRKCMMKGDDVCIHRYRRITGSTAPGQNASNGAG